MKNPKLISKGKTKPNYFRHTHTDATPMFGLVGSYTCRIVDNRVGETLANVYGKSVEECNSRADKMIRGVDGK